MYFFIDLLRCGMSFFLSLCPSSVSLLFIFRALFRYVFLSFVIYVVRVFLSFVRYEFLHVSVLFIYFVVYVVNYFFISLCLDVFSSFLMYLFSYFVMSIVISFFL